ncbi:MAG: acyl-CoA desaturase [Deltaproteobacteria bacterium]|nr:acyl-CoA desaturase [Deltaproteobacteria bacterium]
MFAKTALIMAWLLGSYGALYLATNAWEVVLLAISVGLAMAGLGFNIQHDGGHAAYSKHEWINVAAAHTLDFIGGSSYVWHWKHNVTHHTYANIAHVDADTDVGAFARLTPHHTWRPWHALQHVYIWGLYGMLPFKWIFWDDFHDLATGHIGSQAFPRPKPGRMAATLLLKLQYFGWAIVLPLMVRPWRGVLLAYVVAALTLGVVLAVVFQLAHCVGEAEFPVPKAGSQDMNIDWATHQVATTVDFARDSKFLTWFLGGLNFQVEHHLFPRVTHLHFPALSKIVESTCAEFGVPYRAFPTFGAAVRSHARWLRRMGQRPAEAITPTAPATAEA